MTASGPDWLTVRRGTAPLIVSLPHTGTDIPPDIEARLVSPWLARVDCDWWIDRLYEFAADLDATILRTAISRTVIDVNRDPSGASLYPGQATTGLCPDTTFDGDSLYLDGCAPNPAEIARRRGIWFDPYHAALQAEIDRLRAMHDRIVVYEAHSIRSRIPRLFDGLLPHCNIGTADGASCAAALTEAVVSACADHAVFTHVLNGRFKGGWITRRYGAPGQGVHAVQMELACRGYMRESEANWPSPYDLAFAQPMHVLLRQVLDGCIGFAEGGRTKK